MNSKIIVTCSKCQTKYSAAPEQAGKKGTCTHCGAKMRVPRSSSDSSGLNGAKTVAYAFGGTLIWIMIFVAGIFLTAVAIKGGIWLSATILPWLSIAMWIVFMIDLFFLLPLSMLKKRKGISSIGFMISSYVYGITLWLWGLLLTYILWGGIAVFIGLFIVGIGVVPMAMIATTLESQWSIAGQLVLLAAFTFSSRIYGIHLAEKADELAYDPVYG